MPLARPGMHLAHCLNHERAAAMHGAPQQREFGPRDSSVTSEGEHLMINGIETPKKRRGFAAMSVEKQREIARKGGRAADGKGASH